MNMLSRRGFMAGLGLATVVPSLTTRAQTQLPAPVGAGTGTGIGAGVIEDPTLPRIDGTIAYTVIDPATGTVLAQHLGDVTV